MTSVPERPLDAETVAECHRAFRPMLERYAWAILRDWSSAADAVQNAFVALTRFGGDVLPESRRNWLFRVVHREAMRIREKRIKHQSSATDVETIHERPAEYLVQPLDQLVSDELVGSVFEAMKALPPDQQKVVQMRIFEEKSFAEISAELEIPLGTALSRMRLALERLRANLK